MSSLAHVISHLEDEFAHQRLVFWHDPDGDYADELASVDLPGVTVSVVSNDEYALKYRMLHEQPDDKFLVYRQGVVPAGDRELAA